MIFGFIRSFAKQHQQFTIDELVPPLTRPQAMRNCHRLYEAKELKRIHTGKSGVNGNPPVYQLA